MHDVRRRSTFRRVTGLGRRTDGRSPALVALVSAAVIVVGVLVTSCDSSFRATATGAEGAVVQRLSPGGQPLLPRVAVATLQGGRTSLRDLSGKGVLVVTVWASWCTQCREESAAVADVLRSPPVTGVSFVGIDEQDSRAAAQQFVRDRGTSFPQLLDPDGRVLRAVAALPHDGIPTTLVVDRHGLARVRLLGAATAAQLRTAITAAAA